MKVCQPTIPTALAPLIPPPGMQELKRYLRCSTDCKRTGTSIQMEDVLESGETSTRVCPLFRWKVSICELDRLNSRGGGGGCRRHDSPAFIQRVEFHLHPTFAEPVRVISSPPFMVAEEGYGSFDIKVVVYFTDPEVPPHTLVHSLLLDKPKHDTHHTLRFLNPSAEFVQMLTKNFPIPTPFAAAAPTSSSSNAGGSTSGGNRKRNRDDNADDRNVGNDEMLYGFNVDELTSRLYSLQGPAVFKAVDLVKRYRTQSSYIEEEAGEFHFDLFTLSPDAVHALWDLTAPSSQAPTTTNSSNASLDNLVQAELMTLVDTAPSASKSATVERAEHSSNTNSSNGVL